MTAAIAVATRLCVVNARKSMYASMMTSRHQAIVRIFSCMLSPLFIPDTKADDCIPTC